jgi:hypothetical protein
MTEVVEDRAGALLCSFYKPHNPLAAKLEQDAPVTGLTSPLFNWLDFSSKVGLQNIDDTTVPEQSLNALVAGGSGSHGR